MKYLSIFIGVSLVLTGLIYELINLDPHHLSTVLAGLSVYLIANWRITIDSVRLMFKTNLTHDISQNIKTLTDMANIARKNGILALEKVKSDDYFLQSMINHCVDGADPEFLSDIAQNYMKTAADSRTTSINFIQGVAWISIVWSIMLSLVTSDWLFTAFGVIVFIAGQAATVTLKRQVNFRRIADEIVINGMVGIQRGVNPRMLKEALDVHDPDRVSGKTTDEELY